MAHGQSQRPMTRKIPGTERLVLTKMDILASLVETSGSQVTEGRRADVSLPVMAMGRHRIIES